MVAKRTAKEAEPAPEVKTDTSGEAVPNALKDIRRRTRGSSDEG